MLVIGLTGNIGSGKSTVSRLLKDLGAKIIDTDQIARDVVAPGTNGLKKIVGQFGTSVLNNDGTLNRREMARIVFDNKEALKKLNSIVHPEVRTEILKQISNYKLKPKEPLLVIEVPLLFEAGMNNLVDETWLVTVNPEVQISRIINRDNASVEEAQKRIAAQMPQEEKIALADKIIDNSNGIEETLKQVKKMWLESVKIPNGVV